MRSIHWMIVIGSMLFADRIQLAAAQCHRTVLVAPNGEVDGWGRDVALIDDELVVVADHGEYADVFQLDPLDGWRMSQRLDAASYIGTVAGANGWMALVGAGAMYMYERTASGWVPRQTVAGPSTSVNSYSPVMDESGTTILTQAVGGRLQVFERTGSTWQRVFDQPTSGWITSASIHGNRAVAGYDTPYSLVTLERGPGGWSVISSPTGAYGNRIPSVAIGGDWLALHTNSNTSSVRFVEMFRRVGGAWVAEQQIEAPDLGNPSSFGSQIRLRGDLLVIAHQTASNPNPSLGVGAVAYYELISGTWTRIDTWRPIGFPHAGDSVDGLAVDPTGEWAAVSNWGASAGPGGAGVVVVARRTPMPPARFCPASANSSGAPGRLEVVSTPSVAAGSLDFEVHDVPAFTFGILVYGPTRTSVQLGDGTLCIDQGPPGWVRLDVAQANAGGVMSLSFDYTDAPPADPVVLGNGWVFQALYRDPPGGVAGFNLTDALKIWFCP